MQESIGKSEIRPPCKAVTPANVSSILCTRDYVRTATAVEISMKIDSVGASPQVGKIEHTSDFLTVLSCHLLLRLGHAARSNCWTDFHALWLKRRVSAQSQAKNTKHKIALSPKNANPIKPEFEDKVETTACTSWVGYHY